MQSTKKLLVYIAMSLDGYIAFENDDISWLDRFQLPGNDYGYKEFIKQVGVVVIGASTYKKVLTFPVWPYEQKVYVLTRHTLPKINQNVDFFAGSPNELVVNLKEKYDKNIYLDGGANAIQGFIREGQVDEMTITILPILLGKGKKLFDVLDNSVDLKLVDSKTFENGVVQLKYRIVKYQIKLLEV